MTIGRFRRSRAAWVALGAVLLLARGARAEGSGDAAGAPPPAGTKPGITAEDVRARIKWLASDALAGRMSTEPGAMAASQYVADEFKRLGLAPAGDDGGWFQGFEIPIPRLGEKNALALDVGAEKAAEFKVETDWNPFSMSPTAEAAGPLLFAGYGVTAPEKKYDDYEGVDAKGKVVLVLRKEPAWTKTPSKHATFLSKLNEAAGHGAVALLVVNDPRSTTKAPDRLVHWSGQSGAPPASAKIPMAFVSQATATKMLAPLGKDLAALQKAIEGADGGPHPTSAEVKGSRVRLATAIEKSVGKNARNVCALLKGSDPALEAQTVVVGAHHDHVGHGLFGSAGGPADEGRIHPGADDNASGTAAILEMAEALAAAKERPKRSVLFLSFSGEELGLLGSAYYVAHPLRPLSDMVAMVNCDMVGRYDAENGMEIGGVGTGAGLQDLVAKANEPYGLKLVWDPQGVAPSDNTSFFRKKIPVLFFFTGVHPDYHTPRDTWDKIDAVSEAKITTMCCDVVVTLANRPERLAYATPPKREGKNAALQIAPAEGGDGAGVIVGDLLEDGAADKAGMKAGDVITAFDQIVVKALGDLGKALAAHKPGDVVLVKVFRDGAEKALKVTLGSR